MAQYRFDVTFSDGGALIGSNSNVDDIILTIEEDHSLDEIEHLHIVKKTVEDDIDEQVRKYGQAFVLDGKVVPMDQIKFVYEGEDQDKEWRVNE